MKFKDNKKRTTMFVEKMLHKGGNSFCEVCGIEKFKNVNLGLGHYTVVEHLYQTSKAGAQKNTVKVSEYWE